MMFLLVLLHLPIQQFIFLNSLLKSHDGIFISFLEIFDLIFPLPEHHHEFLDLHIVRAVIILPLLHVLDAVDICSQCIFVSVDLLLLHFDDFFIAWILFTALCTAYRISYPWPMLSRPKCSIEVYIIDGYWLKVRELISWILSSE